MDHLQPFRPRPLSSLPVFRQRGWTLKRYAILADERSFDEGIALAASTEAAKRLPEAGDLADETGNHCIGFQIIHFAEIAVVSPVFYWRWGSVLAAIDQMRAGWASPKDFGDGVKDVIGCVWEMDVVSFEIDAWKTTVLKSGGSPTERLANYRDRRLV